MTDAPFDRALVLYLEERLADARAGRLQTFVASAGVSAPGGGLGRLAIDVQAYSSTGPQLPRLDPISRQAARDATLEGLVHAIDNFEKLVKAAAPAPVGE